MLDALRDAGKPVREVCESLQVQHNLEQPVLSEPHCEETAAVREHPAFGF
jgi:hypothetical protein